MSKRNKGKNAFFFFMEDWRLKQGDRSRIMTLKEASADPRCSDEWKVRICFYRKNNTFQQMTLDSSSTVTRFEIPIAHVQHSFNLHSNFKLPRDTFVDLEDDVLCVCKHLFSQHASKRRRSSQQHHEDVDRSFYPSICYNRTNCS